MRRSLFPVVPLLVAVVPYLAGCNGQPPVPPAQHAATTQAAKAAVPPTATEPSVAEIKEGESWDICYLQGKRVGYGHSTTRRASQDGRDVLQFEKRDHLAIKRAGQLSEQDIRAFSVETPDGKLLRFENELRMGPMPIRTTGMVQGGRLEIEILGPRAKTPKKSSIAWSFDYQGPFATEQTLLRRPMRPGERRSLKMLMCGFDGVDIVDVEMVAKETEKVNLPGGPQELLHIDTVLRLPQGHKIDGVVWANTAGETLKQTGAGLELVRASKAEALAETADAPEADVMASMSVRLSRPVAHPHQARQLCYRVHLDAADPAQVFLAGPTQSIQSIDKNTAEITVFGIRPGSTEGNRAAPADEPTDADRRPSNFVQSEDPLVVAYAEKAAGDEKDPWRVAVALERFVHQIVKTKDFTQGFASAAEVARSLEGDCTEHAVLLAAMARSRGIPARVAIGLVYLDGKQTFFYHMWTEVYVAGRWIPIDGTLALGGIGAGHLKIGHSSLAGASAYSAFLPVLNIVGKLRIEPVDMSH